LYGITVRLRSISPLFFITDWVAALPSINEFPIELSILPILLLSHGMMLFNGHEVVVVWKIDLGNIFAIGSFLLLFFLNILT
jgi:hypothetical protein